MRIAISGHSGCGNTTATTNVGNSLNLRVHNYTFRDLAKDLNMDFDKLHHDAPSNFIYDYLTDLRLIRAALRHNVIVGSRLAAWLMDAELRIWLHAPLEARAARINKREREKNSSYEQVLYKTLLRDKQNHTRYLHLYGIDIEDHSDFDVTINTDLLSAEQVSSLIGAAAQWASLNSTERKNPHLKRISTIIAEKLKLPLEALTNPDFELDLLEIYKRVQRA
jgi:cytidylate kinase